MTTHDISLFAPTSVPGRDPPERRRPVSPSAELDAGFMPSARRPPLVMARGEGSYVWDEEGRRYLDFLQGWAVNALGHGAPELQAALAEQSSLLVTPSPAFHNRPAIELVRLLVRLTGAQQVALHNSGAETNEVAIPKPTIPESPQITDILVRELSSYLAGDKAAQAALDTAALEMHDLLGDCAPLKYPAQ